MRHSCLLFLPLALLLAQPLPATAQFGAIKKKIVDKAAGKPAEPAAAAKPKCDNSSAVITSDVVDRYLKALAARDLELQKLAKEPGQTGAYYSALLKRQAVQRRRDEYDLHKGPDWERHKALQKSQQKKMMQGEPTYQEDFQQDAQLTQSLDPNQVKLPELEWETQRQGNERLDAAMMKAGGFSECDWAGGASERLPRLVWFLANDPDTKDLQGAGSPQEGAAVKARLAELARGLGYRYISPADKARLKAEEEEAKRQANQPPSTGDPQRDCMAKVQTDFYAAHKAEFDAAEKSKDVNAAMKLSQQMALEMAKCSQ
jgi:hypothetical protein